MSHRPPQNARTRARLSAWFDGELGDVEAAEARSRLLDDPAARAQLQEWRGLRADLQALQPEAVEPERLARMRQRLNAAVAQDARALDRALRLWSLAAALMLVLGAGWMISERWLGPAAASPAYASEPRDIERAIEDLLDPRAAAAPARPLPGGALAQKARQARPAAPQDE